MSLSARRAWIEILTFPGFGLEIESLSARRAWIEITVVATLATLVTSLSARRAWIEIAERVLQSAAIDSRSPQGERG